MKYITMKKGKYALIKRKFVVIHRTDEFTQCLGITKNHSVALAIAHEYFNSIIASNSPTSYEWNGLERNTDWDTEETTSLILKANEDHDENRYDVEIIYYDTIIKFLEPYEIEEYKITHRKYFDASRRGAQYMYEEL